MEQMMSEVSNASKKIEDILSNATNAEKCEFDRRFITYLSTTYTLKSLVQKHNHLQKLHEATLREQNKTEMIFGISVIAALALGYLFSDSSPSAIQSLVVFGLIVVVYLIKKDIYEKTYVLQFRMFEMEIERNTNKLKQYGYLLMYEHRITENEPTMSEGVILDKLREQKQEAFEELKLAILKSMYLLPKN